MNRAQEATRTPSCFRLKRYVHVVMETKPAIKKKKNEKEHKLDARRARLRKTLMEVTWERRRGAAEDLRRRRGAYGSPLRPKMGHGHVV